VGISILVDLLILLSMRVIDAMFTVKNHFKDIDTEKGGWGKASPYCPLGLAG
jgi:hypothetical protein